MHIFQVLGIESQTQSIFASEWDCLAPVPSRIVYVLASSDTLIITFHDSIEIHREYEEFTRDRGPRKWLWK